jgi:2-C-methyl-D-erythritol 4-phosphate cytidylyltransferase
MTFVWDWVGPHDASRDLISAAVLSRAIRPDSDCHPEAGHAVLVADTIIRRPKDL